MVPRGYRIVIDPGHGGDDPGAVGNGLHEAHVNLAVAKLLAQHLPTPDYEVILTRESDVFVGLSKRVEIANTSKAKLFVSLHCNAVSLIDVNGFEVLHHAKSTFGQKLAKSIHQSAKSMFPTDRGVKERSDLCVLRTTGCPAVLVEMGFISNEKDAKLLASPEFHLCLAKAIARGIVTYKP